MSAFSHFSKNFLIKTVGFKLNASTSFAPCSRLLSYTSREYDGNPDPGPIFIKQQVQSLLKTLTRVDLAKVFRKRKLGSKRLEQPVYKFMTDKQLEETMNEIKKKVDDILQIPPIVALRKPIDRVISDDPELQGLETSRLIFTDITFGVSDTNRLIVIREPDGKLREAEWEVRDRVNQIYFPVGHKSLKVPQMFNDDNLEDLLNKSEYEYILDRACLQFEPNDAMYQKVVSITYQHLNDKNAFDLLRSTRHFGGLSFFLAWDKNVDNLLLDLLETGRDDEINALIQLYCEIHNVKMATNNKLESVEEFIKKYANKKAELELAFQRHKQAVKNQEELEKGIKRAHGVS